MTDTNNDNFWKCSCGTLHEKGKQTYCMECDVAELQGSPCSHNETMNIFCKGCDDGYEGACVDCSVYKGRGQP